MRSKLLDKLVNVITDFLCCFLIVEVSNIFLHNHFFQIWHILFETSTVDILLHVQRGVHHVQLTCDELHRHLDFHSTPWCCQLPISVNNIHLINSFLIIGSSSCFRKLIPEKVNIDLEGNSAKQLSYEFPFL